MIKEVYNRNKYFVHSFFSIHTPLQKIINTYIHLLGEEAICTLLPKFKHTWSLHYLFYLLKTKTDSAPFSFYISTRHWYWDCDICVINNVPCYSFFLHYHWAFSCIGNNLLVSLHCRYDVSRDTSNVASFSSAIPDGCEAIHLNLVVSLPWSLTFFFTISKSALGSFYNFV